MKDLGMKRINYFDLLKEITEGLVEINEKLNNICNSMEWNEWSEFEVEHSWCLAFTDFELANKDYAIITDDLLTFIDDYYTDNGFDYKALGL